MSDKKSEDSSDRQGCVETQEKRAGVKQRISGRNRKEPNRTHRH